MWIVIIIILALIILTWTAFKPIPCALNACWFSFSQANQVRAWSHSHSPANKHKTFLLMLLKPLDVTFIVLASLRHLLDLACTKIVAKKYYGHVYNWWFRFILFFQCIFCNIYKNIFKSQFTFLGKHYFNFVFLHSCQPVLSNDLINQATIKTTLLKVMKHKINQQCTCVCVCLCICACGCVGWCVCTSFSMFVGI